MHGGWRQEWEGWMGAQGVLENKRKKNEKRTKMSEN